MFTHHEGLVDLAHQFAFEIWTAPRPSLGQAQLPNCASGFLYFDGSRHWLITAAHTVDDQSLGNQTVITGRVAFPFVTIILPLESGVGRGGNGIDVMVGRSTLYFRVGGRLIDLFAIGLEPHEVPASIVAVRQGEMTVSGELARAAVDTLAGGASAIANGMPLHILDRLMILGFANGLFGEPQPPIVTPAIVAAELPNQIGNHAFPMMMSGRQGVSGGPVFRAVGGGRIQLAGVYTHQVPLIMPSGPHLPGSYGTHARYIFAACTADRAPGFQIVDFSA